MKIFSWGPNNKGQHGSGDFEDQCRPNCVSLALNLENIKSIYCGLTYSYIITTSGLVYVCGNNSNGEISLEKVDNTPIFVPLKDIFNIRVLSVATGWDFSVILTDTGILYGTGSNKHCQLGFDNIDKLTKFTPIDLPPMKFVKAGLWHVIALTVNNEIWTWGYNHKAQLGIWPKSKTNYLPKQREINSNKEIVSIIAGAYHSGFMTCSGDLIMWGDNQYGQCGYNVDDNLKTKQVFPRKMHCNLPKLSQLECGWTHSVAMDVNGICYSWGHNRYCQLGRCLEGSSSFDPIPKQIDYFIKNKKEIKEISCGSQHTLAVDVDNVLWSWGWNDHGILGIGDFNDRIDPQKVSNLPPSVLLTSKGGAQSFVLIS